MKDISFALLGNPNSGKSVFFNQLTGGSQHVGNWPGKTVEKAEGKLSFLGKTIKIIDLPGINSLSASSIEEQIARDFILSKESNVILNITDSSSLEKNLYLTLQMIEMECPLVLVLNMSDVAKEQGIFINEKKLFQSIGIPAVKTIATQSKGIENAIIEAFKLYNSKKIPTKIRYSQSIENSLSKIAYKITNSKYPKRWVAIKLLEGEQEIIKEFSSNNSLVATVNNEIKLLEKKYQQKIRTIISKERYNKIEGIILQSQSQSKPEISINEKLDSLFMHNVLGYFFLALILLLFFYSIFSFGGFLSGILEEYLNLIYIILNFEDPILSFFSNSVLEGIIAGLVIAIPYLIPFYILLAVLEDSGYLSRIAYLTDGFMHRIGLHGKAFIPIVLGYGCSVPACIGCRIMENRKQQFTTAFLVTLIPCAARSIIIFSLVAAFLGAEIALLIYVFNLVVVLILGFIASFFIKGETPAMIMNMPSYKLPDFPSIFSRTFFRIRNFIFIAFPIIILST
ncbi:MAG: ferrous iron transport protein B, partial [Candidatus ainarchaeum sp.]|nr:ferrous iron transport protein B [Candidatus ainarchaeum sp.]